MDYQRWWSARQSTAHFGRTICDAWAADYLQSSCVEPGQLVVTDPGNGFDYLFDLAGTLNGAPCFRAPRVIGVWGLSQRRSASRDHGRMRGHPRPGRPADDRGHLISCAAGGGYDINLVPMDAALNRGWSREGSRFRALERKAAARPGTLFFIRPIYQDGTDRPLRFEVGVQDGEDLIVDVFANIAGGTVPMLTSSMRQSAAFPLAATIVEECLDQSSGADAMFTRAWRTGLASLTRAERYAVAAVTGHVAESVTEVLLDSLGWRVLWHLTGPGRHGVDLLFLTPDDNVAAIEVKGTLVTRRIPRLRRRELTQMTADWLDNADNTGMADLQLRSSDIHGGVAVVNFADITWRLALTADFSTLSPVTRADQLTHLSWLPPGD